MKSTIACLGAAVLFSISSVTAIRQYPAEAARTLQVRGEIKYDGCYSSSEGMTYNSSEKYNSKGYCRTQCLGLGSAVTAVSNSIECWCGDELPPTSSEVDDSKCSDICPGYGSESCGAKGFWTIYFTDDGDTDLKHATATGSPSSQSSDDSSPSSTLAATQSVVTVGGQTIVVTASPKASSSASKSSGGGPNKAAIAAGVVVSIVALAAAAGGVFLFLRHRRNRAVEEEYRRNAAVSSFVAGGKPPSSSAGASSFDNRLDPVMAQRRMSDGSIADNQDYSRRILKVTNA